MLVPAVSQSFYYNQTRYKTDNGRFEIVNGHLGGAECDRKLPGGVRTLIALHHGGNSNIASFRSRRGRVHSSWRRGEDSKQSDTVYLCGA